MKLMIARDKMLDNGGTGAIAILYVRNGVKRWKVREGSAGYMELLRAGWRRLTTDGRGVTTFEEGEEDARKNHPV